MLKKNTDNMSGNVEAVMADLGQRAQAAAARLRTASSDQKDKALEAMADSLLENQQTLLEANSIDVKSGKENGLSAAFIDRLTLDKERISAMANGLREIAKMEDPVGAVTAEWERPNGLKIERVRTPLGVVI